MYQAKTKEVYDNFAVVIDVRCSACCPGLVADALSTTARLEAPLLQQLGAQGAQQLAQVCCVAHSCLNSRCADRPNSVRTTHDYPTHWTLKIPDIQLDLDIKASFDNQEFVTLISKPSFYEGRMEGWFRRLLCRN